MLRDPLRLRTFLSGGAEWTAQVTGQTQSGSGSDAGAPLLYLAFAPAGTPDSLVSEGIAVARALDELSDEDLEIILARARPYRTN